jgi:hypothetical protein
MEGGNARQTINCGTFEGSRPVFSGVALTLWPIPQTAALDVTKDSKRGDF